MALCVIVGLLFVSGFAAARSDATAPIARKN